MLLPFEHPRLSFDVGDLALDTGTVSPMCEPHRNIKRRRDELRRLRLSIYRSFLAPEASSEPLPNGTEHVSLYSYAR